MAGKRGSGKVWRLAAAAMVGLSATFAYADDTSKLPQESQVNEAEAGAPSPLLTGVLDTVGIGKFFKDQKLRFGGYVQGSWTYNTSNPDAATIPGRGFDFENQDLTLNGVDLTLERAIEASKDKWDLGFRLDMLYGGDARFTHSNGMFDNRGFTFAATEDGDVGPDEQFDITQALVQVNVPVGRGLVLTIGKFITPLGFEYVDPTKNTLYSHSYLFNYAGPFSQTGILGKYQVADQLTVIAGVTRGWDQSLEDNNSHIDFLGQLDYKPDDQWEGILTLSTGPQQADGGEGYRTVLDALVYYIPTEKLSFGLEALYGIEADAPGTGDDYSQFYGVAFYPSYKVCPAFSVNGRAEWFSDVDGTRGVGANNVYEATLGVTFLPLAHVKQIGEALRIRPEVRFDYAEDAIFDGDHSQTTFAVDAVLAF